MDTELYFRTKRRITNACGISCSNCVFGCDNNGFEIPCSMFEFYHLDKAIEIVENWLKEHPEKTMMMDFFEKHPNALKDIDKTPRCCPYQLGYTNATHCEYIPRDCEKCWGRPMEESK